MKTVKMNGAYVMNDGSGKPMIYRNPFAPKAEYGYDSTTYEQWQNKGFIQTNVDPYWQRLK